MELNLKGKPFYLEEDQVAWEEEAGRTRFLHLLEHLRQLLRAVEEQDKYRDVY